MFDVAKLRKKIIEKTKFISIFRKNVNLHNQNNKNMKKLTLLMICLNFVLCSCNYHQKEAVAAEPSIIDDDELVDIVTADTMHFKVVYIFSAGCKPCLEHLKNEVRQFYLDRDTTQWKFYLVAQFNWLHCMVLDSATQELVELSFADNIRHFAAEYRRLLPSLGYDMSDVYFLYNAKWEKMPRQNDMIHKMFTSDKPYTVSEGVPQFLKADPQNHLCTQFVFECDEVKNVNGKIVPSAINKTYYGPADSYNMEKFDYHKHDTVYYSCGK